MISRWLSRNPDQVPVLTRSEPSLWDCPSFRSLPIHSSPRFRHFPHGRSSLPPPQPISLGRGKQAAVVPLTRRGLPGLARSAAFGGGGAWTRRVFPGWCVWVRIAREPDWPPEVNKSVGDLTMNREHGLQCGQTPARDQNPSSGSTPSPLPLQPFVAAVPGTRPGTRAGLGSKWKSPEKSKSRSKPNAKSRSYAAGPDVEVLPVLIQVPVLPGTSSRRGRRKTRVEVVGDRHGPARPRRRLRREVRWAVTLSLGLFGLGLGGTPWILRGLGMTPVDPPGSTAHAENRSGNSPRPPSISISIEPATITPYPYVDADAPVVFPGYLLPDDGSEEPLHAGG